MGVLVQIPASESSNLPQPSPHSVLGHALLWVWTDRKTDNTTEIENRGQAFHLPEAGMSTTKVLAGTFWGDGSFLHLGCGGHYMVTCFVKTHRSGP